MSEKKTVNIDKKSAGYECLTKAISNELGDVDKIVFKEWPKVELAIQASNYTPSLLEQFLRAMIDIRLDLHQVWCHITQLPEHSPMMASHSDQSWPLEGTITRRSNSQCERWDFSCELDHYINELYKQCIHIQRMDPQKTAKTIIAISILFASDGYWMKWLADRKDERKINLSENPTLKMNGMLDREGEELDSVDKIINECQSLISLRDSISESRDRLLSGLANGDMLTIGEGRSTPSKDIIDLPYSDASKLARQAKDKENETSLYDKFKFKLTATAAGKLSPKPLARFPEKASDVEEYNGDFSVELIN